MNLPGDRLHRVLARWLSQRAVHDVVEPTLADLQHEVQEAGPNRRRQLIARCRGYGALSRALLLHGIESQTAVRDAVMILVLGLAGGGLYAWARGAVQDPRIINSAFLLPMCAAPIALRLGGGGTNYRRTFAALLAVGLVMWAVSGGFVRTSFNMAWTTRAIATSVNFGVIGILGALGAAAVWTPAPGSIPAVRRLILGLLASAVTTTAVYDLGMWSVRAPEKVWAVAFPFYVTLFALPIVVTSLPILFVVHRWIRSHLGLATIGAVVSPVAMVVVLYFELGGSREVLKCLRDAPLDCAFMTFPFTIGNGVLAWSLSAHRIDTR